jgi:type II secretory ATPase GspE/PulE/Tfp pilus assembly ATPase PilB-like protein
MAGMRQHGANADGLSRHVQKGLLALGALTALLVIAGSLWAQDADWPPVRFKSPHVLERGPGFYLSWLKLTSLWGLFLIWAKTTDWVSQDCQTYNFPYAIWNPIVFFPFLVSFFLFGLTVPLFPVGLGLTALALLVPLIVYIVQRNQRLEPHERVLTPDHLRYVSAVLLKRAGVKISPEKRAAHEKGAPVDFKPGGEDPQRAQTNLIAARQSPGYLTAKELLANAVDHRADKIMLDFSPQGATSRYQVDGVWHEADSREAEEAEMLLAVLKRLADLSPEERRKRQTGRMAAVYQGHNFDCQVVSQGTKTGECVLVSFAFTAIPFRTLEELGMREKMVEQLKELMLRDSGILLFSAMPSGGLSTTLSVSLRSTDRLLRDFVLVEDKADQLPEIENVDPVLYDAAAGQSPDQILEAISRKQPDVIVVPDLPNAETVKMLCDMAVEDHLIFTCIRAKEAVEALLRVLLLKVPAKRFAPRVIGVLNQRLVRKLCETCREAYTPPSALLNKLGIPAGRVDQLYRHPESTEEVCPDCHGVGYRGRTAVFELLVVDDVLREALVKQPKLDVLRKAARRAGNRTLQEEGIATVVKGVTSLPELMRVLKQ